MSMSDRTTVFKNCAKFVEFKCVLRFKWWRLTERSSRSWIYGFAQLRRTQINLHTARRCFTSSKYDRIGTFRRFFEGKFPRPWHENFVIAKIARFDIFENVLLELCQETKFAKLNNMTELIMIVKVACVEVPRATWIRLTVAFFRRTYNCMQNDGIITIIMQDICHFVGN